MIKSAYCCLLEDPTLVTSIQGTRLEMPLTAVPDPVPRASVVTILVCTFPHADMHIQF